jgi:hypothetical protein
VRGVERGEALRICACRGHRDTHFALRLRRGEITCLIASRLYSPDAVMMTVMRTGGIDEVGRSTSAAALPGGRCGPTTAGRAATKQEERRGERPNEEKDELLRRRSQTREELERETTCTYPAVERGGGRETQLQAMLHVEVGAIGE